MKFILSVFIAFSLALFMAGQIQAAVVPACTIATQDACKVGTIQYVCKSANGINGFCSGPCEVDSECSSFLGAPFNWAAAKCTGNLAIAAVPDNPATSVNEAQVAVPASLGVCLELPTSAKQLSKGPQEGNALLALVDVATNWVFAIFVVLSIIFVLLAAFQFVTGGGDAKKIEEARSKLIWATVGILIALLAKGLVPVIKNIVGG